MTKTQITIIGRGYPGVAEDIIDLLGSVKKKDSKTGKVVDEFNVMIYHDEI